MPLIKIIFIFCLVSFSLTVRAEPVLKVITLQHRFADDLLPSILPIVGEEGAATGMSNQLIIRVSPDRMPEIIMLINQLDVARVNRRITISTSEISQSELNRTKVKGKVNIGNVTISNDRRTTANTANVEFERQLRNQNKSTSQFLTVLDGERAFIRVGKIVPFTQEWRTITQDYVQIDRTADWREISTGFAIKTRTIGNLVELEVTPRIASHNHQGHIDFETFSTTLRVALHEWVDIGSSMQNHDDISRKILSLNTKSSSQRSSLMIKVD